MPNLDAANKPKQTARRRGRPKTDIEVIEKVKELSDQGYEAQQICDYLVSSDVFTDRAPSLRTVQRIRSERGIKAGPIWSAAKSSTAEEAKAILAVLAAVIEETEGRVTFFTQEEARIISVLREAAKGLSGWDLYRLAREYIDRGDQITEDLDAFLALGAWHEENQERYGRATDSNDGLDPPRFLWLLGGLEKWRYEESTRELAEALGEEYKGLDVQIEQERKDLTAKALGG